MGRFERYYYELYGQELFYNLTGFQLIMSAFFTAKFINLMLFLSGKF